MEEAERRLAVLEEHVAHLESAHQDMSDMITRQWTEIDNLVRIVKNLHARVEDIEPPAVNQAPPHY